MSHSYVIVLYTTIYIIYKHYYRGLQRFRTAETLGNYLRLPASHRQWALVYNVGDYNVSKESS